MADERKDPPEKPADKPSVPAELAAARAVPGAAGGSGTGSGTGSTETGSGNGGGGDDGLLVRLERSRFAPTTDQSLWSAIRFATTQISYGSYERFIEPLMCGNAGAVGDQNVRRAFQQTWHARATPFPDVEPYRLLKVATEVFLTLHCGVDVPQRRREGDHDGFPPTDPKVLREESARYYRTLGKDEILEVWRDYATEVGHRTDPPAPNEPTDFTIPYLAIIRRKLGDVRILGDERTGDAKGYKKDQDWLDVCYGIIREKLTRPCFLELLWSYWHEEGMLVQTINAISQRFQNVRGANNALAQLEISPLRPLSNLLWGYIQDEPFRLSVRRRVYEYDHHYGLNLYGKAVPELSAADSRSQFLEAFHNLLMLCTVFFKQDDDKTVTADGFPVLNALKEVHLLLSEGQHNQYGDLPWTARMEMLIQQWLLARPEFREFLPTRVMIAYPEPWMDRVDAMKKLQGWTDVSTLHFRNLGVFGEQILLSIRFGAWSDINSAAHAANWARYWRSEIQGYTHAYRATTGVDVADQSETMSRLRSVMPSVHLRNRLGGASPAVPEAALPGRQPASLPAAPPARRPQALPSGTSRPTSQPVRETGW